MDLKWVGVAVAGFLCLVAGIAVAVLWPMPRLRRVLRPLAHVDRLTRLPEYTRVERTRIVSAIISGVLLLIVFCTALLTSARPVGFSSATRNFESLHPEDIMLCVGEPVTDPTTAGVLNYFARQARTFDAQRIGLTSPSLRVVPLTRDHQFAADRFERFATLAGLQRDLTAGKKLTDAQLAELRTGTGEFSRTVEYLDYVRSVEDILALCITGFPSFEDRSPRRRSIVYLGFSALRAPDDERKSLFTEQDIKNMADRAGVQINVLSRSDVLQWSEQGSETLNAIVGATGGKFFPYNPAGTGTAAADVTEPTLAADLDQIRANPPDVVLPNGVMVSSRTWDYPNVPLTVSVLVSVLLCLALAVLRR